jgi:hypothetical protein
MRQNLGISVGRLTAPIPLSNGHNFMRGVVCVLVLCLAAEFAFAKSVAQPISPTPQPSSPLTEKSDKDIKEIRERVAFWLKTCLTDWDAATHMTRKEWRTTCDRVAAEREKFLLQGPGAFTMGGKSGRR